MSVSWFLIALLGVWRITHLLAAEDGPGDLVARLRAAAGDGFWGKLLDCFYCLSMWVALPFATIVGENWRECGLLWPALSGAAILVERLTTRQSSVTPAHSIEDTHFPEDADVWLRK